MLSWGISWLAFWYEFCIVWIVGCGLEPGDNLTWARMLMVRQENRRTHQRLPLRLTVICQKVGYASGGFYTASTVNVSSGGMLLEVNSGDLREGELLSVDMPVPPTEGLLEFGGRFAAYARVIRVNSRSSADSDPKAGPARTIALEFCQSPKLRV